MTFPIRKHLFVEKRGEEFLKRKRTSSGRIRRSGTSPSTAGAKKPEWRATTPVLHPGSGRHLPGISARALEAKGVE
jgi:hypothetical protein